MGRRGPKPNPIRMVQLSAKIRQSTRDDLEKAAEKKGSKNLSRELEARLRRSFAEERLNDQLCGRTRMIGNMIALALEVAGDTALSATRKGKRASPGAWADDAYAFNEAAKAAMAVLEQLRPQGDRSPPKVGDVLKAQGALDDDRDVRRVLRRLLSSVGPDAAAQLANDVGDAPSERAALTEPLTDRERRGRWIADGIGPTLHERIKSKRTSK